MSYTRKNKWEVRTSAAIFADWRSRPKLSNHYYFLTNVMSCIYFKYIYT